jgi:hypothetical protein
VIGDFDTAQRETAAESGANRKCLLETIRNSGIEVGPPSLLHDRHRLTHRSHRLGGGVRRALPPCLALYFRRATTFANTSGMSGVGKLTPTASIPS